MYIQGYKLEKKKKKKPANFRLVHVIIRIKTSSSFHKSHIVPSNKAIAHFTVVCSVTWCWVCFDTDLSAFLMQMQTTIIDKFSWEGYSTRQEKVGLYCWHRHIYYFRMFRPLFVVSPFPPPLLFNVGFPTIHPRVKVHFLSSTLKQGRGGKPNRGRTLESSQDYFRRLYENERSSVCHYDIWRF